MKYFDLDYTCGDSNFDNIDIVHALTHGSYVLDTAKEPQPGLLRGGSVGAVIDGNVHGVCHRKAYLRNNGIETPLPANIKVMTEAGVEQENIFLRELQASYLADNYVIRDQTEFDCLWDVNSHPALGSPDVVVFCDKQTNKPVRGLELKLLCSVSKVKAVHYELQPDDTHLIQAANYSLRMGDQYLGGKPLPYQLVYTNRAVHHFFSMSEKNKKPILEQGWDIAYSWGKPLLITPFHRVYNLRWNLDGTLAYWTPGLKNWVPTKVTRDSIDRYYDVVAYKIDKDNYLGPKPTTKRLDGKAGYSPCSYCEFKPICDQQSEMSPQEFKDRAQKLAAELWQKRLDIVNKENDPSED